MAAEVALPKEAATAKKGVEVAVEEAAATKVAEEAAAKTTTAE
jgi:hypothetical protein